jgi:hypothetical protein
MRHLRRFAWAGAASLLAAATLLASEPAQKSDKDAKSNSDARRPKLTLKAQPVVGVAPARVVLTAELVGGENDFEDFYCPTVQWQWGDGTESESTNDCPPFEPGKTELKRRFTIEHVFRTGSWRVNFSLRRQNKAVAFATVSIQVRPGAQDPGL